MGPRTKPEAGSWELEPGARRHPLILVRGGGDLATGVAARLWRSGFAVVVTEIARPRAVRRLVALAEAVYAGQVEVEDLRGVLVDGEGEVRRALDTRAIPVVVDPEADIRLRLEPGALVDGRMRKAPPELGMDGAPLVIGLGPGFTAGRDCHAVVETNRGHTMGRVAWEGMALPDTQIPEPVAGADVERVLRAPADGVLQARLDLGSLVRKGEAIAEVDGTVLKAPFDGALRGLLHDGLSVERGEKIGDLDPRADPTYCRLISDKSLAVGGGVLEALLSRLEIRRLLGG
ncbi:MAG: selenium-dependent molybdenum cofactor biosynthesis protein YqeB [Anaerolineales bacterium]